MTAILPFPRQPAAHRRSDDTLTPEERRHVWAFADAEARIAAAELAREQAIRRQWIWALVAVFFASVAGALVADAITDAMTASNAARVAAEVML